MRAMHCMNCRAPCYGTYPQTAATLCARCKAERSRAADMTARVETQKARNVTTPMEPPVRAVIASEADIGSPKERPSLVSTSDDVTPVPEPTPVDSGRRRSPSRFHSVKSYVAYQATRDLLHTLWTKAVGTPGYDRDEWISLEDKIKALVSDGDGEPVAAPVIAAALVTEQHVTAPEAAAPEAAATEAAALEAAATEAAVSAAPPEAAAPEAAAPEAAATEAAAPEATATEATSAAERS